MVNRRTRANKKDTPDSENEGDVNESLDNILEDSVIEDDKKRSPRKKKSPETEKPAEEKGGRKTRRSIRSTEDEPEANNEDTEGTSLNPILLNDTVDDLAEEKEADEKEAVNNVESKSTNGDPLNSSDQENEKADSPENEGKEDPLENDENSQQNSINSEKDQDEETQNDDDSEDKKPALGLRLVPLNLLLRQDILNKQDDKKETKSSRRSRNKKSYIEISSEDEDEQISINSSSESVDNLSSDSDNEALSSLKKTTRKSKSTNSKLSNGTKNDVFKEPMSPTKIMKNAKQVSINLEKMPDNVNKLMKNYRVNNDPIEVWSESDDFENMIEMSKIDRVALDKSKQEQEKRAAPAAQPREVRKVKSKEVKEKKTSSKKEKKWVEPVRSRSTRNAALNRRKVVDDDSSELEESASEESEDEVPLKSTSNNKKSAKNRKAQTSESEKNNTEDESAESDKNKQQDDHSKEKSSKKNHRTETSSDEEEEKESSSRPTRSTRGAKEQNAAKKSKTESKTSNDKKSSPRKEKSNNLKITISLNQKKVINHSNDDIEDSSKSDSDISSKSSSSNAKKSDAEKEDKTKENKRKKKKIPSESSDSSEDEPLTALVNKSKEASDIEDKSSSKGSDLSEKEEKSDDEPLPIVDQKLRNRNKYEANKDFNKLKELIERKKKSKTKSEDEEEVITKDRVRNGNKGKENHDENGDKEQTKITAKRKRVLSSSEEEEGSNNNSDEESKKSSTSKQDLETPAKKRKKKMDEDSDYSNSGASASEKGKESDSNSDSSDEEIGKGKKRRGKRSSDDDDEELDELEKLRKKEKRRKRIKKMGSSDEDDEDKDKKTPGRKMIRKIMKNDKLDVSTKEAAKIERERKQRIEERQKTYNQFYDERPEELKEITQLVLDFDEETKEPLLQVDKKLVKKLKPHQANGVKFMWDACFESLERCRKESGSGCILAHCMGLGKTLQVITLVHTLMANSDETDVTRVLVVCPLSTVLNWVHEFHYWLKGIKGAEDIEVYEINKLKQNVDRANKLMEWHNEGGVMILSYDMFRNLTNDQSARLRKKVKESLQTSLIDPGPDLVICDEGHLLKNEKTTISKCMMKLRTSRRIVLTGTPLQNNLKEYYCMVQFVKPNLLGKYQEYMNRFVNPITNGQYTDSTEYDIQVMRRRAHVLHKLLDGCVQRRDYSVLAPFLPPKHEYVLSIKLSPMQIRLYKHYMESKARQSDDSNRKGSILFQDFQNLQRIWSAPKALRYNSDRYEFEMQRKRDLESEDESEGSIKDFLDDSESAESTSSSSSENSDEDAQSINSDEDKKKKKKKGKGGAVGGLRRTRAAAAACPQIFNEEDEEIAASSKMENPTEWWTTICPEEELNNIEHSSKLMLLMSILEKCEAIGDKLLVFSQSLYSLDVIEHFLNYIDDQTQHNPDNAAFKASWTLGQDYFRLDGSTPAEQRNAACKHFNSKDNPRARLFLISTRAGGLGINLVAANRVVIFDVSWNPSHDIQSIFRVYRFGQTKPCYVYRFLALGTMEEKIYERQVTKQAISKRVIDEQQIDRHYNQNDLQELYKYELEPDDEVREIPILPKDRLFAEMLQKYEDTIWKYHEHDTLLENKEEETLNEEERKQAWEEFEQEKTRPQFPPYYPTTQQAPRTGPVTSNNIFGIRTDILLKLLSMKARLDNPSISEANVKHAIPLLMQELYRQMDRGELTLYQQLLALSSSLEVPSNYGGKFQVNEALMHQTYNSINAMPSTSSQALSLYRSQLAARNNLAASLQQRSKQVRRMSDTVIEID